MKNKKQVVVIGGGTGTSVVLTGLKHYQHLIELCAIVAVSDSGGSTGRLRDEFGFMPVGDLRQCLASLASGKHQELVRNLLLYRFQKGQGLKGHNLGNLILTALEDLADHPAQAIEHASNVFRVKGKVYPIAESLVNLYTEFQSGQKVVGEHWLDDPSVGGQKIKKISLKPKPVIYSKASQAILSADLIVMGPGDLYASLLPNSLVDGFGDAITKNKGKFVYIVNLMTHYSQTHQFIAKNHLNAVIKYVKRKPDIVIINNGIIHKLILEKYAQAQEYPVFDDLDEDQQQVIRDDYLSKTVTKQSKQDKVPRSLLRHDSQKLAMILVDLL